MTTTPPDGPLATFPGSPQPDGALLHIHRVEHGGTLTGTWVDPTAPPDIRPGAVLLAHRHTVGTAGRPGHLSLNLYRVTAAGRLVKAAAWCHLDHTWPAVIAATVAHWLRHDNR
jgi:hypothetical protein